MPLAMQTRSKMCGPRKRRVGRYRFLGESAKGHAVVGEHGVDFVGEDVDYVPEEGRTFHLAGTVMELDGGELRHAVDCQEHDQLAIGMPQFATVDMDVSGRVGLEPSRCP